MSAMSRNKGKAGEREIAVLLADLTGCNVRRRVRQRDGDSDLEGLPGWSVEVKRHAKATRATVAGWWNQAVRQAEADGGIPVLFWRQDRDEWRAVWPLAVSLTMQQAAMWSGYEWTAEGSIEAWAAIYRELIPMNNQSAQGQWDTDILASLSESVSFEDMGFDRVDVEVMFAGDPRVDVDSIFKDTPEQEETKGALEEIKAERAEMKKSKQAQQSADHYLTVVCKDAEEKAALNKHLGIPKGELYVSPAEIFAMRR